MPKVHKQLQMYLSQSASAEIKGTGQGGDNDETSALVRHNVYQLVSSHGTATHGPVSVPSSSSHLILKETCITLATNIHVDNWLFASLVG